MNWCQCCCGSPPQVTDARAVVDRLAEEVFLLARATLDRLDLRNQPTDVVLGGSVLAARHPLLMEGVRADWRRTLHMPTCWW